MPIRHALEKDLREIIRIYNQAVERSTATFDLKRVTVSQRWPWFWRFDDEHPLLVHHQEDGTINGFAHYLPYRNRKGYARTKELSVYVDYSAHRQGIGRALAEALLVRAEARGVHSMLAVIGGDNPASDGLHRALGFKQVGRLPQVGRKFDQWLDTVVWHKQLGKSA